MTDRLKKVFDKHFKNPAAGICQGEVVKVDKSAFTCEVKRSDKSVLKDVQLKALKQQEKGLVLLPKVGTTVWLLNIGEPDWLVIDMEEIDEIHCDAVKIVWNRGLLGGVPASPKLVERLNKLEDALTELQSKFNSHQHITNKGDVAAGTLTPSTSLITKTTASDIENPDIKQ